MSDLIISLFEVDGVLFSYDKENTIIDINPNIVSLDDIEKFMRCFSFKMLICNIYSCHSFSELRSIRLFESLFSCAKLKLLYHLVEDENEKMTYQEKAVEYRKNSIKSYLTQNYPIDDITICKHLKIKNGVEEKQIKLCKYLPLNSVYIYDSKSKDHKNSIYNIMYDTEDCLEYGDIIIAKGIYSPFEMDSKNLIEIMAKLEKGEKLNSYFADFTYIEGMKQKIGVASMHCLELINDEIYTKQYDSILYLGKNDEHRDRLVLRLTNHSRIERLRKCKLMEQIFMFVSRLAISTPYCAANILFSKEYNTVLSNYLWPFILLTTNQYQFIINIEDHKIKKQKKSEIKLCDIYTEDFAASLVKKEEFTMLSEQVKEEWRLNDRTYWRIE